VIPKLLKMDDVEVLEGESAQFRAEIVQGTPAPTITWFREDALIPENEDFAVSFPAAAPIEIERPNHLL